MSFWSVEKEKYIYRCGLCYTKKKSPRASLSSLTAEKMEKKKKKEKEKKKLENARGKAPPLRRGATIGSGGA